MQHRYYVIPFVITNILIATMGVGVFSVQADQPNSQQERTQLQQQLQDIENQIAEYQKQLTTTQAQKNTLQNKINQLKKQQATLQLQIKSTNILITDLDKQLSTTQQAITTNKQELVELQKEISTLIELIWQHDRQPIWYNLLGSSSITDFFTQLQNYLDTVDGLQSVLEKTTQVKQQLTEQQTTLQEQQEQQRNLLAIKLLQQQALTGSVQNQSTLLQQTKGKESNYQKAVTDAQKQAASIRTRLYQLLNVNTQITFGQALEIAQWVSGQTGVRAAFLLAILTQESNLGRNVGTCNRAGDPATKSWRAVMKPDRDQKPFLAITKALGMDPDVTPVSCPMFDKATGKQVGWGGAMGPAQFIPSTWTGYSAKVAAMTGAKTANPWDIRDAFTAAGIKLKNDGANGTRQGEWNAAMRYFSGSTNVRFRFYGDNVLSLADGYQADIDKLK